MLLESFPIGLAIVGGIAFTIFVIIKLVDLADDGHQWASYALWSLGFLAAWFFVSVVMFILLTVK